MPLALFLLLSFAVPQFLLWLYLRRLVPGGSAGAPLARALLTAVFLVANAPWVLIAHAVVFTPTWRPPRTPLAGAWVAWQILGVVVLAGLVLYEGTALLQRRKAPPQGPDPGRRAFLGRAVVGTAALAIGAGGYGRWNAARLPPVTRRTLLISELPPALEGFTIAHLTDIHAGFAMDEDRMRAIVEHVNLQSPDLIVVTGDLVDGGSPDVGGYSRAFRDLAAPHGVVAVLGNHDHYIGRAQVTHAARDAGQVVLAGGYHVVERAGAVLTLLGVDDPLRRGFDPPQDRAVRQVAAAAPPQGFRLLLAHRPGAFDAAARLGIPLTLAGHTHGGQIGLPFAELTPARLVSRYPSGHYLRRASQLYVSRGVGCTSLPIRLGVPPELPLLTLSRQS